MRYRLMATYRGAPFEAGIGPSERDVMLFAACPPPEDLRFEPATGHWRKQLRIEEVQALRESRPVGVFRGERCMVLDDLGDRLHIAYLGHDAYLAESLGYWQVDRGVFELITPRDEVSDIIEARRDFNYPARRNSEPGVPCPLRASVSCRTSWVPVPSAAGSIRGHRLPRQVRARRRCTYTSLRAPACCCRPRRMCRCRLRQPHCAQQPGPLPPAACRRLPSGGSGPISPKYQPLRPGGSGQPAAGRR